jgi:cation:H+ antiporter
MIDALLLVAGLALLLKGADFLVDGASEVAERLGISHLVIGLTVVAFGTSMPEVVVTVISGTKRISFSYWVSLQSSGRSRSTIRPSSPSFRFR